MFLCEIKCPLVMTDVKVVLMLSLVLLTVGVCFFLALNYVPEFFVFGEPETIILVSLGVSAFLFVMWIFLEATSKKPEQHPS